MLSIYADAMLTATRATRWDNPADARRSPRAGDSRYQREADRRQLRSWLRETGIY